ncbi:MAG: hypothetical protein HY040_22095 [Planctomycetes bacterium]|nr:hypothetical protein [Planctomycetota bacterium]
MERLKQTNQYANPKGHLEAHGKQGLIALWLRAGQHSREATAASEQGPTDSLGLAHVLLA